ncbi:MAG: rhodanese-like domain-containing protein [Pseudomonadota bacterium]
MPQAIATVDEANPADAYAALRAAPEAVLIDVRSHAEWSFVGITDLSALHGEPWLIEWAGYPHMERNLDFVEQIRARIGEKIPPRLFFLCRSGVRSLAAAQAVAASYAAEGLALHCTNITEGFEGDRNADGHRGQAEGWKARGLPWVQS